MKKSIYTSGQEVLLGLLRQLRADAGLTQRQMAKKLDTLQAIVSNYETGERRLDILELRQVCDVLGISLLDFVSALEAQLAGAAPAVAIGPGDVMGAGDVVEWDAGRRSQGRSAGVQDSAASAFEQDLEQDLEQEPLIAERRFFAESLPLWMEEHAGTFALVNERELIGFFSSFAEASAEGARRFGTASHLIREVGPRKRFTLSAGETVYIGGDLAGPISTTKAL
ncbi:MAG: helix-turn-helix domain-containing protein [Janthinobacterium lividum]